MPGAVEGIPEALDCKIDFKLILQALPIELGIKEVPHDSA
jgi:hypothetical protein